MLNIIQRCCSSVQSVLLFFLFFFFFGGEVCFSICFLIFVFFFLSSFFLLLLLFCSCTKCMHAPLTFHCVLLIINLQWLFSSAVHDHLMSDDTLSFVASHIGIGDLMLCAVSNVPIICCCCCFVCICFCFLL